MKKFRRVLIVLSLIAVMCIGTSAVSFADLGAYTIDNYNFKATLHKNNVMSVTETINVDFSAPRHGIYRSIPTEIYVNRAVTGTDSMMTYRCKVKHIKVNGYDYSTEHNDGYVDIKIGSADYVVDGRQTYVISYDYVMPDDCVDNVDFIYYSVLGSDWGTSINKFNYSINFEKPISEKAAKNFSIYSGRLGSPDNELNATIKADVNGISGSAENLEAYDAVTVLTTMEDGYFVGAYKVPKIPSLIFLVLFGVVCILVILKRLQIRNDKPVVTVEFEAPDGISPAEVGTIMDESVDNVDIMSLIPWFASKGYLSIEEIEKKGKIRTKKGVLLHKLKEIDSNAPRYQKTLFNGLFGNYESVDMTDLPESFADKFSSSRDYLDDVFSGVKALSTGSGTAAGMAVLVSLAVSGFGAFCSRMTLLENIYFAPFTIIGLMLIYATLPRFKKRAPIIKSKFLRIILFAGGALGVITGAGCMSMDSQYPVVLIWVLMLVAVVLIFISSTLTVNTEYRTRMMGKLLGLKQFIKTAEEDRLKMLVDENPEYFYDILPYAMVFGMAEKWAKKFADIPMKQPDWYQTNGMYNYGFNSMYLYNSLNSSVVAPIDHANAAAARAAAAETAGDFISSGGGGGGGGFSGGGGGGGGGGSW